MTTDKGESIEEQRKVEGFGDPQYTCSSEELAIRHAIYIFFQNNRGSMSLNMTQDWAGNTLHVAGTFRPAQLATAIYDALWPKEQGS